MCNRKLRISTFLFTYKHLTTWAYPASTQINEEEKLFDFYGYFNIFSIIEYPNFGPLYQLSLFFYNHDFSQFFIFFKIRFQSGNPIILV